MLADAQVIDAIYTLRKTQPLARVLDSRKTWIKLPSNGIDVARCTLERVMGEMGWRGASKKKRVRMTIPDPRAPRPADLVDRQFDAAARNRWWVADVTYCRTFSGWAYTAFVTDVFARKVVGWKVASEMTVNLVTDAINNAIDNRKRCGVVDLTKLVHHSDAGSPSRPRSTSGSDWPRKGSRPRSAASETVTTTRWRSRSTLRLQERDRRQPAPVSRGHRTIPGHCRMGGVL